MRKHGSGAIVAVSSVASVAAPAAGLAYKASKAAMNATVQNIAMENARHGVRVNSIMPGLIDTPMAVEGTARLLHARSGGDLAEVRDMTRKARDSRVPLKGKQGTAWDIAHAALFLASDESQFITGVTLPVDGGQTAKIG